MPNNRFKIIYDKVDEMMLQDENKKIIMNSEASLQEIDEIAELRKIVLETTEPEALSYTTT